MRCFAVISAAIAATLLLAGCSGEAAVITMPDVVGKQLDVAVSDMKRAGFGDDVEVLGGGMFGVVDESNWMVCTQEPQSGAVISSAPRFTVDRSCDEADAVDPAEPAPSVPGEITPFTDAEVIAHFRAFFDERAAAGVLFAQAITDVSVSDRILHVTFDPASIGYDQESFDYLTPFAENYAEFVINPMAYDLEPAIRARATIDSVETTLADGTPRGTLTTEWVVEMNDLG